MLWLPQRLCVFKVSVLLRLHKFFYRRVSSAIKREKTAESEHIQNTTEGVGAGEIKEKKEKKRQHCASEERVKCVY